MIGFLVLVGGVSRAGDFSASAAAPPTFEMTGGGRNDRGYVRNDRFTDLVLAPNDPNGNSDSNTIVSIKTIRG
jgi:hypothetical protein